MRSSTRRDYRHPAYWAFIAHRVSGLLLALFLPVHFLVLSRALNGEAALDGFLKWTEQPVVQVSEIAIVFLLAAHLAGGLRLLLIEFVVWRRESQRTLLALAGGAAAFCALAFALNLL